MATLPTLIADVEDALFANVYADDTTAALVSGTDEDGELYPDGFYAFTIDKDVRGKKEYFTANLVGTALTDIQSVDRQGNTTAGFQLDHRAGAKINITSWVAIQNMKAILAGEEGIDAGNHLYYATAPTGLTGNELATVAYVLSVVSGGTVAFDQQVLNNQTLGETISVNDVVYLKNADARWWKADADLTATFDELELGVSKTAGSAGASATIARSGPVSGFVGLVAGSKYYLSNTAGAISTSAGTNSVYVGTALTTTILLFSPRSQELPTAGEKDALAGSNGIPSSTNKYVTQSGTTAAGVDQSQTTQNTTSSVGTASTTGLRNKVAQSFVAGKTSTRGASLYKAANTGTFAGTVTVSIQADTSGSPSGSALATKTITNTLYNAYATGEFLALFASETALTVGTTYWLVVETSTADSANRPNLGSNSAGGYASGSMKYYNATDGWVAIATEDLYFKIQEGVASKSVNVNSASALSALPSTQKVKIGNVAVSTTATSVSHGFGKVPTIVRGFFAGGDSSGPFYSNGTYDVANNAYAYIWGQYNETAGSGTAGTTKLAAVNRGESDNITISSIDENVVVFIASGGGATIAYEIIG